MRHRKDRRKLGRTSAHRKSLLTNLAIALIVHGRITTTLAKSKELRRLAEKLVTLAKRENLHSRRRALAMLNNDKEAVRKLFGELGPQFQDRAGGYTRIVKLGSRQGDGAPMAIIELLT